MLLLLTCSKLTNPHLLILTRASMILKMVARMRRPNPFHSSSETPRPRECQYPSDHSALSPLQLSLPSILSSNACHLPRNMCLSLDKCCQVTLWIPTTISELFSAEKWFWPRTSCQPSPRPEYGAWQQPRPCPGCQEPCTPHAVLRDSIHGCTETRKLPQQQLWDPSPLHHSSEKLDCPAKELGMMWRRFLFLWECLALPVRISKTLTLNSLLRRWRIKDPWVVL